MARRDVQAQITDVLLTGVFLVLYHNALQNFLRHGCIGPKWVSLSSHSLSQEFYSTVRDKCWEKCITKPSSSLSSSEQTCLARCCDRYAEVNSHSCYLQPNTETACYCASLCVFSRQDSRQNLTASIRLLDLRSDVMKENLQT